jgi:hypothetical protein
MPGKPKAFRKESGKAAATHTLRSSVGHVTTDFFPMDGPFPFSFTRYCQAQFFPLLVRRIFGGQCLTLRNWKETLLCRSRSGYRCVCSP